MRSHRSMFHGSILMLLAIFLAADAGAAEKVLARLKVCPGQECTFGEWRARTEVNVYKDRDSGSEIVFKTAKGDYVTGMAAELLVHKLGSCVVKSPVQGYQTGTKAPVSLAARDHISAFYFSGENYVVGNYKKMRIEACCVGEELVCRTEPESELWLKVKSKSGVVGWTNQRDQFSGTND